MTTAYNIHNKLARATDSDRRSRVDPGSAGTLIVGQVDRAICECSGAGTRTLQDATTLGLGTEILVTSQTAAVVIAGAVSVTIGDGEYVKFEVVKNSSDVNEWRPTAGSKVSTLAAAAVTDITGNTSAYVEATINLIVDCLVANGLATDSTTT